MAQTCRAQIGNRQPFYRKCGDNSSIRRGQDKVRGNLLVSCKKLTFDLRYGKRYLAIHGQSQVYMSLRLKEWIGEYNVSK